MKNKKRGILLSLAVVSLIIILNSWGAAPTRQPQPQKQTGTVYSQIVSVQRIINPNGSTNYITRMTNLPNRHLR